MKKLGAQLLIELGIHEEIGHWAGTRTFEEVWGDCPKAEWMSEILSKLGPWVINPPWDLVLECVNTRDPGRLRRLVPWSLIEYTLTKGSAPFDQNHGSIPSTPHMNTLPDMCCIHAFAVNAPKYCICQPDCSCRQGNCKHGETH